MLALVVQARSEHNKASKERLARGMDGARRGFERQAVADLRQLIALVIASDHRVKHYASMW